MPSFHSPPHSLNFNNGKTYEMFPGGKPAIASGVSLSSPVVVPKGQPVLRFGSRHGAEALLKWVCAGSSSPWWESASGRASAVHATARVVRGTHKLGLRRANRLERIHHFG